MFSPVEPSPELLIVATEQAGVLTTAQASGHGLGRHSRQRLLESGRWQRLTTSIYFVHDTPPPWVSYAWAGTLLGGPQARLGGLAAAKLYGITDLEPRPLTVMVPEQSPCTSRPPWRFQRERPGIRSDRSHGDPPRLTIEDTVLDLCDAGDEERVVEWVTKAVQHRLTIPRRLREALSRRSRVRHRRLIEGLLQDVADGAETFLEVRYLHDVERTHGLPRGERQHCSRRGAGFRDVRYREQRTVVELDGRLGHVDMGRFRDMRRDNLAALDDEVTLRYGSADVLGRRCLVAGQVAELLIRRGWTGALIRCPRCPPTPVFE